MQVRKKENKPKQKQNKTNKQRKTNKTKQKKQKQKQKPRGKCNQVGAMIFHPYRANKNIVMELVQKPFKGYGLNES